jgi:hypothetical protein
MARKFREKRELRDAIKRKQESQNAPKLVELLGAFCVYNSGIVPENIKNITMYSLRLILQMNGEKERYNSEMNFLYNGADPKKLKPKYWIKNI